MLPIPHRDYVPRLHRNSSDMIALAERMDSITQTTFDEARGLQYLYSIERCPSTLLDTLGNFVSADILPGDTDRVKRQKIANAIQNHRQRGTWTGDVKVRLDIITGQDAALVEVEVTGDWILFGAQATDPDNDESVLGFDNVNLDFGLDLLGDFTELNIPGNIVINLHQNSTTQLFTPEQIAEFVAEITDPEVGFNPAYYRLILGWVDASGEFNLYATI